MAKLSIQPALIFCMIFIVCNLGLAHASESSEASIESPESVLSRLKAIPKNESVEFGEVISDYLFILEEGKVSSAERLRILNLFFDSIVGSGINHFMPIFFTTEHWLNPIVSLSVTDVNSLKLLNASLKKIEGRSISSITSRHAEALFRLACDVAKVQSDTADTDTLRVQVLWKLSSLAENDKEFGRKLATLAVEQMAKLDVAPEEERRDASAKVLRSYFAIDKELEDGDLLIRDVNAISKIVSQSKKEFSLDHFAGIYQQLQRRCSATESLVGIEKLLSAALDAQIDEGCLQLLRQQLSCAQMRVGNFSNASEILAKRLSKPKLIDKVLLAECLVNEHRFTEAEVTVQDILKVKASDEVRFPSMYVTFANAISAEIAIKKKQYDVALPLLISADSWFGNSLSQNNMDLQQYPYLDGLIPSENRVLSDLVFVYNALGKTAEAKRTRGMLETVSQRKNRSDLFSEKEYLLGFNSLVTFKQDPKKRAERIIEICQGLETAPDRQLASVLECVEVLLRMRKYLEAQACLRVAHLKFTSLNDQALKRQFLKDSILAAELSNNKDDMKRLFEKFLAEKNVDDDFVSEIETRMAILNSDFVSAERASCNLEKTIYALSADSTQVLIPTPRDKFVSEHRSKLLDRVHALNALMRYEDAARLARLLLVHCSEGESLVSASSALLGFAYKHSGHNGLGVACQKDALLRLRYDMQFGADRYFAIALEQLAVMEDESGNKLRAKRYRMEAKKQLDALKDASELPALISH